MAVKRAPASPPQEAGPPSPVPGAGLPAWHAVSRGAALFLGLFVLLQVGAELRSPRPDSDWWWIDLRPVPVAAARGVMALYGCLLLVFGATAKEPRPLRMVTWALTLLLFLVTLSNAMSWYARYGRGDLQTPVPVPAILQLSAIFSVVLTGLSVRSVDESAGRGGLLLGTLAFDCCLVMLPVVQIVTEGPLDDRRPSAALVIDASAVERRPGMVERWQATLAELAEAELFDEVVLVGPAEARRFVREELLPADDGELSVTVIDEPGITPAAARDLWQRETRTVLLAGDQFRLPEQRVVLHRAGLDVAQAPVDPQGKRSAGDLLRAVGRLWLTYVRVGRGE